jgi:AcrR family transcriptional regulator
MPPHTNVAKSAIFFGNYGVPYFLSSDEKLRRFQIRERNGCLRDMDAETILKLQNRTNLADAKKSARGRPRQIDEAERRKILIESAEKVFVDLGYSAASVDDIAKRAGMSKKTLYQLFETKEELFAAVIAERRAALKAMIQAECCGDSLSPAEVLRKFLGEVARFVLARRQAALYRLVIAESQRAPELACAFYQEGPSKVRQSLTQWLQQKHECKELVVPDPDCSASMLCSMVIGEPQMRLLIGDMHEPESSVIDERVAKAVALFLDGALPR